MWTRNHKRAEVFFSTAPLSLTTAGAGVAVVGDTMLNNAGAIEITIPETISPESLIKRLADAVRGAGIPVAEAGHANCIPDGLNGDTTARSDDLRFGIVGDWRARCDSRQRSGLAATDRYCVDDRRANCNRRSSSQRRR